MKSILAAATAAATAAVCLVSVALAQTVVEIETVRPSGERVAGDIVLPENADGPVPAVMLVSGSGAQNRHAAVFGGRYALHDEWAERLNAAGFAAIRYDEPGTGESEGAWAETGLFEQKNAIRAIMDVAVADPRIDPERIFVIGHSAGAFLAMMLSAEDASLAGIIPIAGAASPMWDVIEYQNRRQAEAFSEDSGLQAQKKAELDALLLDMTRRYAEVREVTQFDGVSLARMVRSPALVLHGTGDYQVPPENAAELVAAMRLSGIEAEFLLIPGVNHILVHDPENRIDYEEIETLTLDGRLSRAAIDWLIQQAAE